MNELASRILSLVGGKDNVLANATCMTRLRLTLRDLSLVDQEALRQEEGVMGLVVQDQVQVILGPGKVNQVGLAFAQLTGLSLGYEELAADQVAKANKAQQKAKYDKPLQRFLQRIANIFIPLLPGIIAAGMINGIANVINVSNQNAWAGEWWFQAIRTMGWALFAFLPIYVGMNAAKEFKGSAVLGGMAGALSVVVPSMPLLAKVADEPILLPSRSLYGDFLRLSRAGHSFYHARFARHLLHATPNRRSRSAGIGHCHSTIGCSSYGRDLC